MVLIIALMLLFALVVGFVASSYGRSGILWFLLSLVISPILSLILLLIVGKVERIDPNRPTPATHVVCPDCAELVKKEARVCKHCGCKLVPDSMRIQNEVIGHISDGSASGSRSGADVKGIILALMAAAAFVFFVLV